MNQLADLGRVLALLRALHGFSRGECAARIGVTVERLVATEQGELEPGDLGRIARLYALDEDELREGMLRPVAGVGGATIFLLQGAYPDFDARDLGVLERAMRAARSMTALAAASDEGRERLRQRLQFVPTSPAGPRPADAARQGHKLARLVRARLGLGAAPIEDIRVLLEEQLGIAVVVDRLVSQDLRATSIIDMHRAAAAAVIAHHHPDIEQNPLLARVYLAHELAHILFDPGAPGVVRLALDAARLDGAGLGAASNLDGLLESRAKGFAAELLIPLEGVTALLGAPGVPESSLARARQMVAQVREHFGTPWDIAAYHLGNLGFIQRELSLGLRTDKQGFSGPQPVTTLPEVAATPVLLARMLATNALSNLPGTDVSDDAIDVQAVRRAAETAIDDLGAAAIDAAYDAVERGRKLEAAHLLMEHFDDLFHAGEFEAAGRALAKLDPHRLPRNVLTAVLMETRYARDQLGKVRIDFLARVQSALADTWSLSAEDIAEIVQRLA